ncbi:hypothetical protein [Methanobacterium alcaliphilum]|uniref:hypothetical protein n=1 Tax=Methanobacterium alcaliphilum TaxID=392018 RepID=UPI002009FF56|nr:hypothetical protein [Methanobacterium alcaliphilum]MCK9152354.1 hypothetical protein [Methanobacterium alcaliphilum]
MSCYLRHMKNVMKEAGLDPQDKYERKEVDLAIRRVVGEKEDQKCNLVWKKVKIWLHDVEKYTELVDGLKEEYEHL